QLTPHTWKSYGTFESFEQAVRAANDWIAAERVDVVNVETVLLPVKWDAERSDAKTTPPFVNVYLTNRDFNCLHFVRVWYRLARSEQVRPAYPALPFWRAPATVPARGCPLFCNRQRSRGTHLLSSRQ